MNYPAPLTPGGRPEGWNPRGPDQLASVSILTFTCERIAVGPLERGPVHFLMERHGNAVLPEKCAENQQGITRTGILTNVVLDDAEVGAYLQSTYGMPVSIATFSESQTDVQAGALHHLEWSIDGQSSSVSIFDNKMTHQDPPDYYRSFWAMGEGVVAFDLDPAHDGPQVDLVANGTLSPPMLLASDTGGSFIGGGAWYPALEGRGAFTIYADRECNNPLP